MSLSLTPTHLLTAGAVIFAGFALYETFKKPAAGGVSLQPAQAQRDAGLMSFNNLITSQFDAAAAGSGYYGSLPVSNVLTAGF